MSLTMTALSARIVLLDLRPAQIEKLAGADLARAQEARLIERRSEMDGQAHDQCLAVAGLVSACRHRAGSGSCRPTLITGSIALNTSSGKWHMIV